MKNNKKWFSLPMAMGIVILITLLSITLLEYIVPFSRDIKSVENSSVAYYGANSWIEEWLYHLSERTWESDEWNQDYSWRVSNYYKTYSSWSLLPPLWEWNSEYDIDWNTISAWNPIQLSIWNWYINPVTNIDIMFRVPDLDNSWPATLSWWSIINWQLSWLNETLNAWISIIKVSDIWLWSINMLGINWIDLNWVSTPFATFYNANCNTVSSRCILKFSVVNKLETINSILIPYLEWQLEVWTNTIPLRYTKINWWWKANWFKKELDIKVATETVNEAFDFTVFQ